MHAWIIKTIRSLIDWMHSVLDWFGRYEVNILVAMLVLLAAVLGFIVVADEVASGNTLRFDEWALRILRKPDDPATARGPGWLAEVGRDITALGGIAFLTLLTVTIAGFLWLRKMYAAMWLLLASALGGLVMSLLLKHSFHRPRPELVPHLSQVYTTSFPSGHAMLSATVFLTLGALLGRFVRERPLKAYFMIVAGTVTFLVGLSRVYMGVHYPTDVLAGWTAGLAWALVCWLIARFMQHRGMIEQSVAAGSAKEHVGSRPGRPRTPGERRRR